MRDICLVKYTVPRRHLTQAEKGRGIFLLVLIYGFGASKGFVSPALRLFS